MRLLVKNGTVIDPVSRTATVADVLCEDGRIAAVAPGLDVAAEQVWDAGGKVVMPALVDIHTHAGEPGHEQRETWDSLGAAAVRGGIGTVVLMPDTDPVRDSVADVRDALHGTSHLACRVHVVGALTKGRQGEDPTEWGELADGGVAAIGDAKPIADTSLIRRALTYLRAWNVPVVVDCMDEWLARGAAARESYHGTVNGLRGMPAATEEVALARDLAVARLTKGRLHVQRISTARSVELIAQAKDEGLAVTAEVSWLHLLRTDEALGSYDTALKVWPPLGTEDDRQSLIAGVASGVIDAIVTDHTPYTLDEKDVEFDYAPWGAAGLEQALTALWSELVLPGHVKAETLVERFTAGPARVMNLDFAGLQPGARADFVVLETDGQWLANASDQRSLASNYPYRDVALSARVGATVIDGVVRFQAER